MNLLHLMCLQLFMVTKLKYVLVVSYAFFTLALSFYFKYVLTFLCDDEL